MTYIPGNYWAIDPITGFKVRISEFTEQPTKDNPNSGDWVWKAAVDPVHPQEYVQGVEDDPSVPLSFADTQSVVGETTLVYATPINNNVIVIPTSAVVQYDPIGVVLNDGTVFWDFMYTYTEGAEPIWDSEGVLVYASDGLLMVTNPLYDTIELSRGLFAAASSGNIVYLPSLDNEEWQ